ncbi:MAG TPA: PAS domain S-box protein [Candidatus Acidoferrum sp.]|nr:PAS domain S-box protein [Candidatus Acidoferrum sp.]
MLENQGLLGSAFFEATASIILLVLFALLRREHDYRYFRLWLAGWIFFTCASLVELAELSRNIPELNIVAVLGHGAALFFFLLAVMELTARPGRRGWPLISAVAVALAAIYYWERGGVASFADVHWGTGVLESTLCLAGGFLTWRWAAKRSGHGMRLLAGLFLLAGLHGLDRPLWPQHPLFILRVAFEHLLGVSLGIAMVVVALERARTRSEETNEKMRRLTQLTAASMQTASVSEALDSVLQPLVEGLGGTHGIVRLIEENGKSAVLTVRASVGFSPAYLAKYAKLPGEEAWAKNVLKEDCLCVRFEDEQDPLARARMAECGIREMVTLALRGKEGPLGIIAVGATRAVEFLPEEISYLVSVANLLGLTLQSIKLFAQVAGVQQQWAHTFDAISDPIVVHERTGRISRVNQRLGQLLARDHRTLVGRSVAEVFPRKEAAYDKCPYCEGLAGEGEGRDPWLGGYFLASSSAFKDPLTHSEGVVHVLKDITERQRAQEKYRTLVASVQEGVFISTPGGRFLDFNDALLRMTGYDSREELLALDIPRLYVNPSDRERLRRLLQEHGSVADFEFEMRRKDGEMRVILESCSAVRDAAGQVTAYQGFILDITERKSAEGEIRRRNRELMVLNSIAQTLTESMDLGDSLQRTLRQMIELFGLDAASIFLLEEKDRILRRVAAVGQRSEYARALPAVTLPAEILQQITSVHATFLSAHGLPLPPILRDLMRKEGMISAYVVILWAKDRIQGALVVGSRTQREFSPADVNLLIAVGSQISSAMQRALLYEEARQAYENLRRTQEQLLHSDKMAAVGQLISGVAHELNNPLTAILGYSQLLTSSGQTGPQGLEYADKLYKQAQRTHRIVQNLLSFSRQHKPERVPVRLNQLLEETLALRDYDLRMSNVRVHLELDPELPATAADPHQLQQVFLNMVNNAVDAILEHSTDGDLWVHSGADAEALFVEFTDSGPGVQDASKVFDPFYTTKPVGKGTGLGLSICYGIVTEHGGTIRVRNVPPRGASFRIELPRKAQPTADGANSHSNQIHVAPVGS